VIEWKRVYFAKGNRFSRSVCRYVGEAVHRRACAVLEEESLICKRASVEESCEFISVCIPWRETGHVLACVRFLGKPSLKKRASLCEETVCPQACVKRKEKPTQG